METTAAAAAAVQTVVPAAVVVPPLLRMTSWGTISAVDFLDFLRKQFHFFIIVKMRERERVSECGYETKAFNGGKRWGWGLGS